MTSSAQLPPYTPERRMLIDGELVAAADGGEFDNVNPCTGEAFHYSQIWHIVAHTDIDPFGEEYVTSQHINSTQSKPSSLANARTSSSDRS